MHMEWCPDLSFVGGFPSLHLFSFCYVLVRCEVRGGISCVSVGVTRQLLKRPWAAVYGKYWLEVRRVNRVGVVLLWSPATRPQLSSVGHFPAEHLLSVITQLCVKRGCNRWCRWWRLRSGRAPLLSLRNQFFPVGTGVKRGRARQPPLSLFSWWVNDALQLIFIDRACHKAFDSTKA